MGCKFEALRTISQERAGAASTNSDMAVIAFIACHGGSGGPGMCQRESR